MQRGSRPCSTPLSFDFQAGLDLPTWLFISQRINPNVSPVDKVFKNRFLSKSVSSNVEGRHQEEFSNRAVREPSLSKEVSRFTQDDRAYVLLSPIE